MEMTVSLFQLSFYAAIGFTIFGGFLALLGIWIKEFWESETAMKLLMTDIVFAVTSIIVAVITKFLGG